MSTIPELVRKAWSHWDDAAVLTEAGVELHERNRLETAREVLARAVELDADNGEAWEHYAYTYLRDLQPEKGLEILRGAAEKTGSESLQLTLAAFTSDNDERKRLMEGLEASDDPNVQAGLASIRSRFGDKDALDQIRTLQREHSDHADIRMSLLWNFLTRKASGQSDFDVREEAVPLADAAIAAKPARIMGYWMRNQLWTAQKDWNALRDSAQETLAQFPDDETAMYLLGRAHRELGENTRAADALSRAIGMKASYAGARVELAKVFEAQDKPERAEQVLREAIVANPRFNGSPLSLAAFLGRQERWEESDSLAVETWNKMADWEKQRVKMQPDIAAIFERESVKSSLA